MTTNNPVKGTHEPSDCNDHAQLNALFADAQRVKPNDPPKTEPLRLEGTEEQRRIMLLNFWDI